MPLFGNKNPEGLDITSQGGGLVETAMRISQFARSARIPPSVVVEAAVDDPQLKADLITLFKIVRMVGGGSRGGMGGGGSVGLSGSGQGLRPGTIRQIQQEMRSPAQSSRRNSMSGISKQRMAAEAGVPIAQEILQSLI